MPQKCNKCVRKKLQKIKQSQKGKTNVTKMYKKSLKNVRKLTKDQQTPQNATKNDNTALGGWALRH